MKKTEEEFVEEITTNFSELFVDAFLIRYLSEYDKNNLLDNASEVISILNVKVKNQMQKKLKDMGFATKDIKL